jgi:hypothetical protein
MSSVGDVPFEISSIRGDKRRRINGVEEERGVGERITSRDMPISGYKREVVKDVVGRDKSAPKLVETRRHD